MRPLTSGGRFGDDGEHATAKRAMQVLSKSYSIVEAIDEVIAREKAIKAVHCHAVAQKLLLLLPRAEDRCTQSTPSRYQGM